MSYILVTLYHCVQLDGNDDDYPSMKKSFAMHSLTYLRISGEYQTAYWAGIRQREIIEPIAYSSASDMHFNYETLVNKSDFCRLRLTISEAVTRWSNCIIWCIWSSDCYGSCMALSMIMNYRRLSNIELCKMRIWVFVLQTSYCYETTLLMILPNSVGMRPCFPSRWSSSLMSWVSLSLVMQ